MTTFERLTAIEKSGVTLSFDGSRLKFRSNSPLNQKHVDYINKHKTELSAAVRIRALFPRANLADVLTWYQDDLAELNKLAEPTLKSLVSDYLRLYQKEAGQCS